MSTMNSPENTNQGDDDLHQAVQASTPTPPDEPCHILKCPVEILMMFSEALGDDMASRAAFARTCKTVNGAVEPNIYRDNIAWQDSSAILWATIHGELGTLEKAVRRGGKLHQLYSQNEDLAATPASLLHWAVFHGQDDTVAYLLDHGLNIHHESELFCDCPSTRPVPTTADEEGDMQDSFGINPFNEPYTTFQTALHLAICTGYLSTARLLINRGALEDPIRPLFPRQTAIRTAAAFGHHSLFPEILAGRMQHLPAIIGVTKRPSEDETEGDPTILDYGALHYALDRHSNTETITALIDIGADLNENTQIQEHYGRTLLDLAIMVGRWDIAPALIQYGARPEPELDGYSSGLDRLLEVVLRRVTDFGKIFMFPEEVPSQKLAEEGYTVIRCLVQAGANFHGTYAKIRRWAELPPLESGRFIRSRPLPYIARHCCHVDSATATLKFLLEMGVAVDELDHVGDRHPSERRKTALATLVDAFAIDYADDYDIECEEGLHAYLDTKSDQLHIWAKERRLFGAIESLLQHGASPMERPASVEDEKNEIKTESILEIVLNRFPRMPTEHDNEQHEGHRAARVGINTLKLARLFARYADRTGLPVETRESLDLWIREATKTLREHAPVTDLSVRTAGWRPKARAWRPVFAQNFGGRSTRRFRPSPEFRRPLDAFDDVFYANRPPSVPVTYWQHFETEPPIFLLGWYGVVRPGDDDDDV